MRMELELNMAVVNILGDAVLQGEGGLGLEAEGAEATPYSPMPNDRASISDDKTSLSPPLNFSQLPTKRLQPAITPIIPLPRYRPGNFMPTGFKPTIVQPLSLAARNFSRAKDITREDAAVMATELVTYFSRPLHGTYEETRFHRDGGQETVVVPYSAPLPMLTEFANSLGFTENELKRVGKNFPKTLGRALAFARDVTKTTLVRKALVGEYSSAMSIFVATNETDMKVKSEHTEKHIDMNDLLDRIEAAEAPMQFEE